MTKKIPVFLISVLALFLFSMPVLAQDFYIENYDVNIQVNKSKQAHVTENIDVFFNTSMHGIYRDISHNNGTITNISVSEHNQINENGKSTNIKIGYPDRLVSGKHHYTISYNYNYFDNKNEFYHNIIGNGWNVNINHVNFNITMPKEFNPSKVGLSIGKYGVSGFEGDAEFKTNGLNVSGQVNRILYPGDEVTVRISVPEGYFDKTNNKEIRVVIALLLILTFISFVIWYTFGKDERAISFVNFYPPENMNVLETEIAYKESASTKGLVAMLISLAQRGYIKIHEEYGSGNFTLERLKYYNGNDKLEKEYMSVLFSEKAVVTKHELETSRTFYKLCNEIIDEANEKKNNIYEKSSVSWGLRIIMAICLLGVVLITFLALVNFNINQLGNCVVPLLFTAIALAVLIFEKDKNLFIFIWALGFGGIPFYTVLTEYSNLNYFTTPIVLTGLVGIIICSICLYHLKKRNKSALRLYGKLLGFKKFIETAEKHKLQLLVEKEPQYFYNILPYAYLFNISDKWISKFEDIMQLQPDWYSGTNFNSLAFRSFSDSMNSVSVPSVSNGGISTSSSGGGGFSGGGGGGGGGGGW